MLSEIGAKEKPEILLLNKTDTDEGAHQATFWKTLHPGAIAISAKTGAGLGELHDAVLAAVRGTQVDVRLTCEVTNGKLIGFIRTHAVVHEESIENDHMVFDVTVGKQLLAQLKANDQVAIHEHHSTQPA
ncbi:MAG: hypothetical protein ACTHLN_05500 [Tepidisphaeraceae bacterium]